MKLTKTIELTKITATENSSSKQLSKMSVIERMANRLANYFSMDNEEKIYAYSVTNSEIILELSKNASVNLRNISSINNIASTLPYDHSKVLSLYLQGYSVSQISRSQGLKKGKIRFLINTLLSK